MSTLLERRTLSTRLEQMEVEMTALRAVMALALPSLQSRESLQKAAESHLKSAVDRSADFGRRLLGLPEDDPTVFTKLAEAGVAPPEAIESLQRAGLPMDWTAGEAIYDEAKRRAHDVTAFRRHAYAYMARNPNPTA